jgi:hypothetical protein
MINTLSSRQPTSGLYTDPYRCLPPDEPIDLLNVAFERPPDPSSEAPSTYAVPDRTSGIEAYLELKAISPDREWRFVEINITNQVCFHHPPLHAM